MNMIPMTIKCEHCGSNIEVSTYRKFVVCSYCGLRTPFSGFEYKKIDWSDSMYAHVKKWMDCPSCRSKNMYLGSSGTKWLCPDCGYSIPRMKKLLGVFWFCDDCETLLNVQNDFSTKTGQWKCTECGHISGVSKKDII